MTATWITLALLGCGFRRPITAKLEDRRVDSTAVLRVHVIVEQPPRTRAIGFVIFGSLERARNRVEEVVPGPD